MIFLRRSDYTFIIKQDILDAVMEFDDLRRVQAEQSAILKMESYLTARYITNKIFFHIPDFDINKQYAAGEQIYYNGSMYVSNNATNQGNIPPQIYNNATPYIPGNVVFFDAAEYTCIAPTTGNTPGNGSPTIWQLNTTWYWQAKDLRNPLIVEYLIDLVLYTLHAAATPRNIPEIRAYRYSEAIKWLEQVSREKINPHLPKDTPSHDYIRFGSNPPLNYHY